MSNLGEIMWKQRSSYTVDKIINCITLAGAI